jgi:outer membrane protein assembly factor BamB
VLVASIVGAVTIGLMGAASLVVVVLARLMPSFDVDIQVGPTEQTEFDPRAMPGRELLWSTWTDAEISSAPVVDGAAVYLRDRAGRVRAFNALTGEAVWTESTGRAPIAGVDFAPVVAEGVVYVTGWDGMLHAFDAGTGTAKWNVDVGPPSNSFASGGFPLTVADGSVFVNANGISAFDAATGAARWTAPTGTGLGQEWTSYSKPVVGNGMVYVGGNDGAIHALDMLSGAARWSTGPLDPRNSTVSSRPTFAALGPTAALTVEGGLVYAAGRDGKLYALEAHTGRTWWTAPVGVPNEFGSAPVVKDGTVYVATDSLHALDAATGTERWSASTGGASLFAFVAPVVENGAVHLSGGNGLLHEFDANTGERRRSYGRVPSPPDDDPLVGRSVVAVPPAITSDLMYLGSGDHRFYAYWHNGRP